MCLCHSGRRTVDLTPDRLENLFPGFADTHTKTFFSVITLQSELAVSFFFLCSSSSSSSGGGGWRACMVSGLVRGVHSLVNNEAGAQRENTLPLN